MWHAKVVSPAVSWLLNTYAAPVYGAAAAEGAQRLLRLLQHAAWLLPIYVISILVSCMW